MNRTDAERIAKATNIHRPDWPVQSLITILADQKHRVARDVAIAMTWIALDPDTRTPRRIAEDGPWWKAASPDLAGPSTPRPPRSTEACKTHAGGWRDKCAGCAADQKAAKEEQ